MFQHLVAFVQDKVLDFGSVQLLVSDQSHGSTGSTDNNVRALLLVCEQLLVGGDGRSTVEHARSDIGHELGETGKLVSDLVSEFTSVTQDDDRDFSVDGLTENGVSEAFRSEGYKYPETAHICCKAARTKTAVLPIPDLA